MNATGSLRVNQFKNDGMEFEKSSHNLSNMLQIRVNQQLLVVKDKAVAKSEGVKCILCQRCPLFSALEKRDW